MRFCQLHQAMSCDLRDAASIVPELMPRVEMLAAQIQQRLGKKHLAPWPKHMAPMLTTRFATDYVFAANETTRAVLMANVR
jgi:hypothetical protein